MPTTSDESRGEGPPADPTVPWEGSPYPELYGEREPSTPVCAELAGRASERPDLVLVHHLHDTGEAFVRALAEEFPIRRVIGVPYSAVPAVVERLRESVDVVVPDAIGEIPALIEEAVLASTDPVVVEEIGGYSASIADTLDAADHVRGVVEDTNQGHWRWAAAAPESLPVRSVADCALKRVEDSVVGKSVVDGLARYLAAAGARPLADQRVHVLGFGRIGAATARRLSGVCESVSVFDTDPIRLLLADATHRVVDGLGHADVVVGATGNPEGSVRGADVPDIADGTRLVSASSRRVEFDLEEFAARADAVDRSGASLRYAVGDRRFHVANDGKPINLRYSRLPSRTLDLVYGALVHCIGALADGASTARAGVESISAEAQRTVAGVYLDCYDVQPDDAPR
jgi:adenosylhomocysteinase